MSQLKRTGNKVLLKGGVLEDAITAAITAMNEPKTCSTTTLRRYLIDANKDRKQYQLGKRLLFCNHFMVPGTGNVYLFGAANACATYICPLGGTVAFYVKYGFLKKTDLFTGSPVFLKVMFLFTDIGNDWAFGKDCSQ